MTSLQPNLSCPYALSDFLIAATTGSQFWHRLNNKYNRHYNYYWIILTVYSRTETRCYVAVNFIVQWKLSIGNPVLNRKLPTTEISLGPMDLANIRINPLKINGNCLMLKRKHTENFDRKHFTFFLPNYVNQFLFLFPVLYFPPDCTPFLLLISRYLCFERS